MKKQIMVTVSGSNQADLIKDLSAKTNALGGKWLNSKISHIDDYFSGLLKVEIQDENIELLLSQFKKLGIAVDIVEFDGPPHEKNIRLELTVDAKDRSGLVHQISQVLSDNRMKVDDMQCHRLGLPDVGVMFTGKFQLLVDEDFSEEALLSSLAEVSKELVAELHSAT